jgi:phosphohistidine phosphatase SixA
MDKIALISHNPIVSKIFTLVLKKLSLELKTLKKTSIGLKN